MRKTDRLTADRARELFSVIGGDLVWKSKSSSSSRVKLGSVAGTLRKDGYISVWVDGVAYLAHRIVWLMEHGQWPEGEIDHKFADIRDNQAALLRDVSHAENMQNQRTAHSNSRSGLLGAHWRKDSNKWVGQIKSNKTTKFLGYFDSAEDAHAAYLVAKRELHLTCTI